MHFLHTNLQYLRSQVVFYKERDIPYRKRGLTFCFPFQRLQGLYLKEIVLMVQKRHLICIQFHKNMVPFANRFQHHLKSRSVYQWVFFAIMPFFEEKVENNLEYGMFFKTVHHLLEKGVVLKHNSKISRCCFYVYSGPSINESSIRWQTCETWCCFFNNKLIDGDAFYFEDNGTVFQNVFFSTAALFVKRYSFPVVHTAWFWEGLYAIFWEKID